MTSPGQFDLDGNEEEDPRALKVARALWWNDARRTWGESGRDVAEERAKACWPTIQKHYLATARVVLAALDS